MHGGSRGGSDHFQQAAAADFRFESSDPVSQ
jgi:hypothetical protein